MNITLLKHIHMMNSLKLKKALTGKKKKNWLKLKICFNSRTCVSAKGTPI